MARQLALLFARRLEVPVVLTDLDQARVDKGVGYVHGEIDKLVGKGRLDEGTAAKLRGLVSGSVDKAAFADADFVIEAVFEDLAVKKQVWAELEKIVSPEASWRPTPPRCRSPRWPPTWSTRSGWSGSTSSTRSRCCRCWRSSGPSGPTTPRWPPRSRSASSCSKSCVLVKDAPAFVVNRLLTRFLGEIYAAVDAGTPVEVADTALDPLGLPMRPLALLAAGRAGGGAARRRDAARGVPGPVRRSARTWRRLVEAGQPAH